MSQEPVEQMGFGFVDDTDESLRSKSGGKFGLNSGAFLTKFELNSNAGKDGTEGDALDFTVMIGDREFRNRIYPTTRVYKDNVELTDKTTAEYKKLYNDDWSQKNAVIVHVLKVFRTGDEVKAALNTPIATFKDFINVCAALLPDNFQTKQCDTFLEYQWQISDGQDRTFLQMPKNMKGGYFFIPQQPVSGAWTEVRDDKGLRYVDAQGNEHPFTRDKNFIESPKGYMQSEGDDAANATLNQAAGTDGAGKPSNW